MEDSPKLGIIIVCRMDSSRCRGKTLANVQGKPLLSYVVDRAQQVSTARVIIATSDRMIDNPIADFADQNNLDVFRGSTGDVAGRMLRCADRQQLDWFARVNGDSPYLSAELIEQGFHRAVAGKLDFVTNLAPRSYPYGVACEILRTQFFAEQYELFSHPEHFEHVTARLYKHLPSTRFLNLSLEDSDLSDIRMTVDTPEDLSLFRSRVASHARPWSDVHYSDIAQPAMQPRRAA